jgi:hypothetical protein
MQTHYSHIGDRPNPIVQTWERNAEELEDTVSQCLPLFYRRAYRCLESSHDAEGAVQDALLSAHKHLDQFQSSAKMTTGLTTIVTNSALAKLRGWPRQPICFWMNVCLKAKTVLCRTGWRMSDQTLKMSALYQSCTGISTNSLGSFSPYCGR